MKKIHLCHHAAKPTDGRECLEAIWSQGRACKACSVACYRQGWAKVLVDADNRVRVAESKNPTGRNVELK